MSAIVDPELAAIAHLLPRPDLSDLAGVRELERRFLAQAPPYRAGRELTVTDVVVPGLDGPGVRVRVVAPTAHRGPLPGLLYLRSSGFVTGSLDSATTPASRVADLVDVAVVAVDYRLSPEDPYPAALDDCYAALAWATSTEAARYGIDPGRVGVLGDSAGGNLAVAVALRARERNGPAIAATFLDAPTIDDRCDTPSMREFTDTPMWRAPDTPIIWQHYLGSIVRGGEGVPVHAAPARASVDQLVGLPPAWVATYQLDPTRDEVLEFAVRLARAGVPTELHHYAGAFHLTHIVPGTAIGQRMLADKLAAVRRMLAGSAE